MASHGGDNNNNNNNDNNNNIDNNNDDNNNTNNAYFLLAIVRQAKQLPLSEAALYASRKIDHTICKNNIQIDKTELIRDRSGGYYGANSTDDDDDLWMAP